MLRRRYLTSACFLSAIVALPEMIGTVSVAATRPRNLLLITLDTMRADRLPPYGFRNVETPTLSRIAAEGVVYEEAFAVVPLTFPSHASLFTGTYPRRLGVRDNASPALGGDFTTLAEVLRQRHLKTGAFVASAVLDPQRGLQQGFDTYSAGASTRCPGRPPRRRADAVVDEAMEWLRHHDTRRFFAWIHLFDTHRPYDLPAEYKDRYPDPYVAAVAYEDAQIARVIDYLEARGQLNTTLVVIVGDHGESLGDHGEESHGIFLYREALRVPFMMRGPGVVPRRISGTVRLIDVMPTVLDFFGVAPSGIDGISLAKAGLGGANGPDLEVYAESMYPRRFGWAPLRSLRADRYKVIDAPRPELYDLATDPGEERNVIAERPAAAAAMLGRLRSLDSVQTATDSEIDAAVLDRIRSLGYVGNTGAQVAGTAEAPSDPKDVIDVFNRITSRQWQQTENRLALCR